MLIETDRLKIYTLSKDEMECLIGKQTDEILVTAYKEMLQGAIDHPESWDWYAIWIIRQKNGIPVGDLCFKGFNSDGSVEIGYGITEDNQNHGYATEAVAAAAAWALNQPGVTRVEAETEPNNKASQRVLEKCGFMPTGTFGEEGPRFVKTQ